MYVFMYADMKVCICTYLRELYVCMYVCMRVGYRDISLRHSQWAAHASAAAGCGGQSLQQRLVSARLYMSRESNSYSTCH